MPLDAARADFTLVLREPVIQIPGPEDIVVDHAAGIAFVASQQRRSDSGCLLQMRRMPGGAIYALDLARERLLPRLLIDQDALCFSFHPRGCSFFTDGGNTRRLMVISDRNDGDHVVEIFDIAGTSFSDVALRHVRTIVDTEHFVSPNDLVALDGDRFYVANDNGARAEALQQAETLFGLPMSTVAFWDGARGHTVASGIAFANGIALDRSRGRLYVASTRLRKIHAYAWEAGNPSRPLRECEPIPVPGCPDNLEWDEEGSLWIGADPGFLELALYSAGFRANAPSQVLRMSFDAGGRPRIDEVWRDDTGKTISASSVAAVHGKGAVRRLLIGQPFGDFLRDCELRSL